jgi:hypothetical protein
MALAKTDNGREALRSRDPNLSPRERQILILFNGTRSRASVQQLMQRDIGMELHRLLEFGYLEESIGASRAASHTSSPP